MVNSRVVASLTTMPDKYSRLVKTLESLNKQTHKLDAIYLGIPKISRRLKTPYPELPKEITDQCQVVEVTDYGPITKIVAGLISESDPDTVIITFDDDMWYPEDMVEKLLEKHKLYPNSSVGSSGMIIGKSCPVCAIYPNERNALYRISKFKIPKEGRRVDSIYGYPGALYVRKFFPKKEKLEKHFLHIALDNKATLMNDDITISGYLSLKNIERRIFSELPEVSYAIPDGMTNRLHLESEISYNLDSFFQRMNTSIETCKKYGMYQNPEPMDVITESTVGIAGIFIFSLLLVILFALFIIFCW